MKLTFNSFGDNCHLPPRSHKCNRSQPEISVSRCSDKKRVLYLSDQLCSEVAGPPKKANPPPQNVIKEERQALQELAKDTIMVLPADKGKATMVMDTEGYEFKVQEMLTERTYETLSKYPTGSYKHKLVETLSRLKRQNTLRAQVDILGPL